MVRLDVRHWLHRWEAVIKQSHAKYGVFMSALAGAVMAYNRDNLMLPHQVKAYVRRITRGVEVCFKEIYA